MAAGKLTISYKDHFWEQLEERGLIMGDVHYLLKNGFVYEQPIAATREPYWRYAIQGRTPNSKNREIRAVVIPDWKHKGIKIVTVMWVD